MLSVSHRMFGGMNILFKANLMAVRATTITYDVLQQRDMREMARESHGSV